MRITLALSIAALALGAPAAAGPPVAGLLVPGKSLGGLELGATKQQVERSWGRAYGVCTGCTRETWYFNYFAFFSSAGTSSQQINFYKITLKCRAGSFKGNKNIRYFSFIV